MTRVQLHRQPAPNTTFAPVGTETLQLGEPFLLTAFSTDTEPLSLVETSVLTTGGTGALTPNQPATFVGPAGWARDFNATTEGAWSLSGSMNIRDASTYNPVGATAPRNPPASPQNIGEMLYPAGFTLVGNSPGNAFIPGATMTAQGFTQFYHAIWVQLSSNWVSHPSGVNKVMIANLAGAPMYVLSATNASAWQFRLQNLQADPLASGGTRNLDGNLVAAPVTLGLYQRIEVVARSNTPGVANGTLDLWYTNYDSNGNIVSGPTHSHSYANVGWVNASQSNIWGGIQWDPIYGGNSSGTLAVQQYMWMDKIIVSGHA